MLSLPASQVPTHRRRTSRWRAISRTSCSRAGGQANGRIYGRPTKRGGHPQSRVRDGLQNPCNCRVIHTHIFLRALTMTGQKKESPGILRQSWTAKQRAQPSLERRRREWPGTRPGGPRHQCMAHRSTAGQARPQLFSSRGRSPSSRLPLRLFDFRLPRLPGFPYLQLSAGVLQKHHALLPMWITRPTQALTTTLPRARPSCMYSTAAGASPSA